MLIGTNDVGIKGIGPYEAVFKVCQQAFIAWLALPAEQKVLATSKAVTTTGSSSLETANNWNALTTHGAGASITFPFTTSAAGAVYAWYRIRDGSTGTFTYAVDGVELGSGSSATTPAMQTQNGTSDSLGLLRLASVAAGQHSMTFTQSSAGANGVGVVAIGLPGVATTATALPLVLVGTLTKGLQPCAFCEIYNQDISGNVAIFAGDGLNVKVFTAGKYMSGTTADMADVVHPNATGHIEVAHAVLDVLN